MLSGACVTTLESHGWTVEKPRGAGNVRVRRITKNGKSRLAAIRTTQDQWIAFARNGDDTQWVTLCDVDVVVVASVDPDDPKFARVHMIEASEMKTRFDRAYTGRLDAGHSIPVGRGVWLSLYDEEASDPVTLVGAGAGIANPPLARVPLDVPAPGMPSARTTQPVEVRNAGEESLTIAEAKARLARTLGVDPSNIKITVEA